MENSTQEFDNIHPVAHDALVQAGYKPVPHKGKLHVTGPWSWHRHGDGWQFYLHLKTTVKHFFEDKHGTLHHD